MKRCEKDEISLDDLLAKKPQTELTELTHFYIRIQIESFAVVVRIASTCKY